MAAPSEAVEKLRAFVQAAPADSLVLDCADEALELVAAHIGSATVPDSIRARAALEVGADLFYRRSTRNGVAGFDTADGINPVRIARDPLRAAYDTLRPWTTPAIS